MNLLYNNIEQGFIDRMIAWWRTERSKTPNEIALTVLLSDFGFLFVVATLPPR